MRKICIFVFLLFLPSLGFPAGNLIKKQARHYRKLGLEAQEKGQIATAYQFYEKALKLDPFYAEVHNDLGVMYEARGEDEKAEESYLRALEIDPNLLGAYTNLALFYEKKGDFLKAINYWRLRYKKGKKGELWTERAKEHLLVLAERFPSLKREFLEEDALELSKEVIFKKRKLREEKIKKMREYLNEGISLFKKEKYREAGRQFQKVLEVGIEPEDREAREIIDQARRYYTLSLKEELLRRAGFSLQQSLAYFEQGDYLSTLEEIRKAEKLISEIPRE